jgi:TPR repeat protein
VQSAGLKPKDVYAPQQLGLIYEALWRKSGQPDDKEKMIAYDQKATELGSTSAAQRLGLFYEALWRKSGQPDDKEKMIAYYQKATQLGSARAKLRLEELHVPVKAKA